MQRDWQIKDRKRERKKEKKRRKKNRLAFIRVRIPDNASTNFTPGPVILGRVSAVSTTSEQGSFSSRLSENSAPPPPLSLVLSLRYGGSSCATRCERRQENSEDPLITRLETRTSEFTILDEY